MAGEEKERAGGRLSGPRQAGGVRKEIILLPQTLDLLLSVL